MCGIFGQISAGILGKDDITILAHHAQQRGLDASGLLFYSNSGYQISKADYKIDKLLRKVRPFNSSMIIGHSRLVTNGLDDNQPVVRGDIAVIHNGIVLNENEVWASLRIHRQFKVDSEVIVGIAEEHLNSGGRFQSFLT